MIWLETGSLLGAVAPEFDAVCSVLVFYITMSAPKRIVDATRVSQSKEAVYLASVSAASLRVIGSRNRLIMMLRSRDADIAKAVAGARRALLLGVRADEAAARASSGLASYSASQALLGIGRRSENYAEGGEESQGLEASEQMASETRLPVFMTVAFFAPIMLLLFAVFSHVTTPDRLAELVGVEVVILDLAFYILS